MGITVSSNDNTHSFDVSDAPLDSLDLLTTALLRLLDGSTREDIEWYLEPQWVSWRFEVHDDQLELQILQTDSPNSLFIISAEKTELINQLVKGLEVLHNQPCWTQPRADEVTWSWMFPSEKLHALLRKMTESHSSFVTVDK